MAGSLNSELGSVRSDAPFPLNESRPTARTHYDNLLGHRWPVKSGGEVMLVQHKSAAQAAAGALVFEFTNTDAFVVQVSSAVNDQACGVSHNLLPSLASDDYFFLFVGSAGHRVSCIDSGSGITAGDLVQCTTGGKVVTDASEATGGRQTLGYAMNTAAASGDVDVMLHANAFAAANA